MTTASLKPLPMAAPFFYGVHARRPGSAMGGAAERAGRSTRRALLAGKKNLKRRTGVRETVVLVHKPVDGIGLAFRGVSAFRLIVADAANHAHDDVARRSFSSQM